MRETVFMINDKTRKTLTKKEDEILRLVTMGKSNAQIASKLFINEDTAKTYVLSILQKMSLHHSKSVYKKFF